MQQPSHSQPDAPTVPAAPPIVHLHGQLELPLEWAPVELREHGYCDAHTWPLVSPDVAKVRRSWRVPARRAWAFPRVELRTGNTYPCITLDCDGAESVGLLSEFILDEALPCPNVIVQRRASGNVHAHFMLATPVHRGDQARAAPLGALARCSEYLAVRLRADRGYRGVLTLNPAWPGPEYQTSYLRAWPFELAELGAIIPKGWQAPAVPLTAIGRNVGLFRWAVREAHRPRAAELIRFHGSKDCPVWERIVSAKNDATYGVQALPASEVRSIARSSARYSLAQYDRERFRELQRARGKRSRRGADPASARSMRPWEADGVSRRTWYRRRAAGRGTVALEALSGGAGGTANHNR